jgi:hypothetical protein
MKYLKTTMNLFVVSLIFLSTPLSLSAYQAMPENEDNEFCDQIVTNCKLENPYSIFGNTYEHIAFDMGCDEAGNSCETLLEEN